MPDRSTRVRELAAATLVLVTLLEWWSRVLTGRASVDYGSADLIAFQALIEDVLVRGGSYRAWHLTPAPYFFPDGLFALVARGLTSAPELLTPLAVAMQVIALAAAAWLALREVARELAWLGPLVVSLATLAGLDGAMPLRWLVFPAHHTGVSIVLLLLSAAFTRFVVTGARSALVAGLVVLVAGSVSDALVVAGLAVAMPVVSLWAWRSSGAVALRLRWLAPTTAVTAIVAGQCARWLVAFPERKVQTLQLSGVPHTLALMLRDVADWPWLTELLSAFTVALCLVVALRARRTVFAVWLLAGVGMFAAVIATGNAVGTDWLRYVLWPVLAALLAASALLQRWRHGVRVIAVVAVVSLVSFVRPVQWVAPWRSPGSWWLAATRCVEQLAAREQAHVVVTDYWRAKPLVFFSTTGLRTAPVQADLSQLSRWIVSDEWFGPTSQTALLVANGLDAAAIDAAFGAPFEVVACGELEVRVYRDDGRARLRAQFERWRRDQGW